MSDNRKIPVLVTAVGSELAFSVLKALKVSTLNLEIIGCDIYNDVVGKKWTDVFYQVPLASSKDEYRMAVYKILKKHGVKIIIPTSDSEFEIIAEIKTQVLDEFECYILVNDTSEFKKFDDKWTFYQWCLEMQIPTPNTHLYDYVINSPESLSYPVIIKPRKGGGSRHIYKANNLEEAKNYSKIVPGALVQEYVTGDEYTAGIYRTMENKVYVIILKRELKFGMTNKAWVIKDNNLEDFLKNIILKSDLRGSNNIQFRLTEKGPKILEINPRFSGTTGIRANFGFNDVEFWIKEVLLNEKKIVPKIKMGKVLRYMEEQYHFNN